MARFIQVLLLVGITESVCASAQPWSLVDCGPEGGRGWSQFEKAVRTATPGSTVYTPKPYPQSDRDVVEDFLYHYRDVYGQGASRSARLPLRGKYFSTGAGRLWTHGNRLSSLAARLWTRREPPSRDEKGFRISSGIFRNTWKIRRNPSGSFQKLSGRSQKPSGRGPVPSGALWKGCGSCRNLSGLSSNRSGSARRRSGASRSTQV